MAERDLMLRKLYASMNIAQDESEPGEVRVGALCMALEASRALRELDERRIAAVRIDC